MRFDRKVLTVHINFQVHVSPPWTVQASQNPDLQRLEDTELVGAEEHLNVTHEYSQVPPALVAVLVSCTHREGSGFRF